MAKNMRLKHSRQELAAARKLTNAADYLSDYYGVDRLALDILTAAEMKVMHRLADHCSIMDAVTLWNSTDDFTLEKLAARKTSNAL